MYENLRSNLLQIQEEVEPCKPRIVAITKYFDENAIIEAYRLGLRDFGESRALEACEKIVNLPQEIKENSNFHFIGHLQTNKVKQVIKIFDYIHSVDSVKLAQCISRNCQEVGKIQKVLLQINNAEEEQKFGFSKDEIFESFEQITKLPALEVIGLMNIAPINSSEAELHKLFSEIAQIKKELEQKFKFNLSELSMGMSQDYRIAASEGATMLRIGRKLFK